MTTDAVSCTWPLTPEDERCRYWVKHFAADAILPAPSAVTGANSLPGGYLRTGGDVELFPGDILMEGEENHHRHSRGWTYRLVTYMPDGEAVCRNFKSGAKEVVKLAVQAGHLDVSLLKGTGDVAAMVRSAHLYRAFPGLSLEEIKEKLSVVVPVQPMTVWDLI